MNNDARIDDIVQQLQQLQIQQLDLLTQLETYRRLSVASELPLPDSSSPPSLTRFSIGDRVRILNPRFLQPNEGIIIKISAIRITLRTAAGNTIVRAPKNLLLLTS